eukprot:gnl/MRDRNA2_/MRDRNA2_74753_c0_seq3.p1 gnl/MRDRNA2_/MRDRNA2_74753_c0~~gnl/MRDRNA2_/MRDRNA2_74753_c0_seq3.p1  ORF type:complete len:512 (-),score=63.17 gnl/MRDRNA2_/MRDRNA2_74753_c0_seq3:89-1531(-)
MVFVRFPSSFEAGWPDVLNFGGPPAPRRKLRGEKVAARDEKKEKPPPTPNYVAERRFLVGKKIGHGSYGKVYSGRDSETGDKVAIKLEWVNSPKSKHLMDEARLYQSLDMHEEDGVPNLRWYGNEGPWNIMVMDLLGPSLEELFKTCDRQFSLQTVLRLGEQMIDLLERVHARDVVHRDVKPHNFLMGLRDKEEKVYILDFGLAKRYKNENGTHVPCRTQSHCARKKGGVTGAAGYASRNVHAGQHPSRRDDLESLGYVLMYFNRGKLPWQGKYSGSQNSPHSMIRKIGRCKEQISFKTLCHGFPDEFVEYFNHCRSLEFTDQPNYSYLRSLLKKVFVAECKNKVLRFDWMLDRKEGEKRQEREDQADSDGAFAKLKVGEPIKTVIFEDSRHSGDFAKPKLGEPMKRVIPEDSRHPGVNVGEPMKRVIPDDSRRKKQSQRAEGRRRHDRREGPGGRDWTSGSDTVTEQIVLAEKKRHVVI